MNDEEQNEKILSLTQTEAQQDRLVNELIQAMIDLNIEKLESVLDNFISARGIEKTILMLIFPFMEKIGILWLTNHINPAQEHLITNLIRQKLIVGIEGVVSPVNKKTSVLLFLPEGEHHEIGLLFVYYLMKASGIKVIYLGTNMPIKDIVYICNIKQPYFLYTHLTSAAKNFHFDKYLINITNQIQKTPIIISGLLVQSNQKKVPDNITLKKSFQEVRDFIAELN
jgi:hypothetical protein